MEANISESNFTKVKSEPTEPIFTPKPQPCIGYSHIVEIEHIDAKNACKIKDEGVEVFVPVSDINLNSGGVTQIISNTGIAPNDIKIMLELSDISGSLKPHSLEGKYRCEICSKSFKTKHNLVLHKRTHTGEKPYKCDVCTKCFSRDILIRHKRIHTGEKNYKCEICTKCFTTKETVLRHMSVHNGERNYKCKICAKCFGIKQNLSRHMKIHASERNYMCDICNKCFITKHYLVKHLKTHSGEKNFKCDICYKCFTTKYSLVKHLKIHSREKKYKCEICTKRFDRKTKLSQHVETHADKKRYKCEDWKQYFRNKKLWFKHTKSHTEGRSEEESGHRLPYNTRTNKTIPSKFEKRWIKAEIDNDTVDYEFSTKNNGNYSGCVLDVKAEPTEILEYEQKYSVAAKEEVVRAVGASSTEKAHNVEVKYEIIEDFVELF